MIKLIIEWDFLGFLYLINYVEIELYFRTLPMGIIDPWIVVIVEWIWLVVLIIIIGIFIGLRIQIQKIRKNSKKTITQLFLE